MKTAAARVLQQNLYERRASALKRQADLYPVFGGFSRRLAIDLVEWCARHPLTAESAPFEGGDPGASKDLLVVAVLKGWSDPADAASRPIRRGVVTLESSQLPSVDAIEGKVPLVVLAGPAKSSPVVRATLNLDQAPVESKESLTKAVTPILVWVTGGGVDVPLDAFATLLGEQIAMPDGAAPVAIVTLQSDPAGVTAKVLLPAGGVFEVVERQLAPGATENDLRALIPKPEEGKPWRGRVLVVNPGRPGDLPWLHPTLEFDQVVFITDHVPSRVPAAIARRNAWMDGEEPYFNSFVAVILRRPEAGRASRTFKTRPIGQTAGGRIFRDACTLHLDVPALERLWKKYQNLGATSLSDMGHPSLAENGQRLVRALTNKRLGVALSGGGAAAFRSVALFEALADKPLQVDIVAGLSGGALTGAYYCARGAKAIERLAVERGRLLQVFLPIAILTTYVIEWLVDRDLGGARVEDSAIRFAAVTTVLSLKPGVPPAMEIVEQGTFGEAVRASGSLPPAFAPTERNGARYTDGGAASIVPARVVRDCGADVVYAANLICGPDRSNPFDQYVLGQLVRQYTPIGRLLDVWTWYAYLWNRASLEAADEADAKSEFPAEPITFLECFNWWQAEEHIAVARKARQALEEGVDQADKALKYPNP